MDVCGELAEDFRHMTRLTMLPQPIHQVTFGRLIKREGPFIGVFLIFLIPFFNLNSFPLEVVLFLFLFSSIFQSFLSWSLFSRECINKTLFQMKTDVLTGDNMVALPISSDVGRDS